MVKTRSRHKVIHMEASYGRAAKKESRRFMKKRKLLVSSGQDYADRTIASTPRRMGT
jgi:hypothetical protein